MILPVLSVSAISALWLAVFRYSGTLSKNTSYEINMAGFFAVLVFHFFVSCMLWRTRAWRQMRSFEKMAKSRSRHPEV
jgi:hypothetical protein